MKIRKFLAVMIAAVMCFSLSVSSFAVNGEEESTQEIIADESSTAEESTSEEIEEEASSEEDSTQEVPEEESSQAPDKGDVISLIISLLSKIDLDEVKSALNDINEALGLPRVESFKDIPAYADALYEKLEDMGLGYADIINGLASSDILDWLNDLIFGGGSSSKPVTTAPADSDVDEDESGIPDTGMALGAAGAAVAVLGGSGALALILRKRNGDEE